MNKDQMDKYLDFASQKLGIKFNDINLLITALTHRSYVNEHPKTSAHNERLEFLGDAVLELVTTDYLYRNFTEAEGILTNWRAAMVKTESIGESGLSLGFDGLIRVSNGEKHGTERAFMVIAADAFEALIGAIYLDQGYETASGFIHKFIISKLDRILETGSWRDAKSYLQEIAQRNYTATPRYKLLSSEGPDHDKTFTVGAFVGDEQMGEGTGNSKQEAEKASAEKAIEKYLELGIIKPRRPMKKRVKKSQ
jgi:ribonuclease-3